MPDLADCQAVADYARYRGRPGYADYLTTRCALSHHHDDEPRPCTAVDHDAPTDRSTHP